MLLLTFFQPPFSLSSCPTVSVPSPSASLSPPAADAASHPANPPFFPPTSILPVTPFPAPSDAPLSLHLSPPFSPLLLISRSLPILQSLEFHHFSSSPSSPSLILVSSPPLAVVLPLRTTLMLSPASSPSSPFPASSPPFRPFPFLSFLE